MMKIAALTALAVLAAGAQATEFPVDVGIPTDQYSPISVSAVAGDTVRFNFHTSSHNVIQSAGTSSAEACQPMTGGIATSIMQDGSSFVVPINNTDTVYIHCGPHCKSNGMVFVINPPNASAASDFMAAASGVTPSASASSSPAASSSKMNGAMALPLPGFSATLAALAGAALVGAAAVL